MKILATGFGPFDKFTSNPAQLIVERISDYFSEVEHVILPVIYGEARETLLEEISTRSPDAVVSFGLNGTIGYINIEEIALNLKASEVADNKGNILEDSPIIQDNDLAYRSTLPTKDIRKRLRGEGIPAKHSYSAGGYLCNEVFYTEMDWATRYQKTAGFIHIPMATEMIADKIEMYRAPHMSMDMIEKAGLIIMEEVLKKIK